MVGMCVCVGGVNQGGVVKLATMTLEITQSQFDHELLRKDGNLPVFFFQTS